VPQLGQSLRLHHYRGAAFHEIDLVIERSDGAVVTVEISATDSPQPAQLSQLAWLRSAWSRQGLAPFAPACCSTPALVRPDPPTASTRCPCRPSGIRRSTETLAAFGATCRPLWPNQRTGRCQQQVVQASSLNRIGQPVLKHGSLPVAASATMQPQRRTLQAARKAGGRTLPNSATAGICG